MNIKSEQNLLKHEKGSDKDNYLGEFYKNIMKPYGGKILSKLSDIQ